MADDNLQAPAVAAKKARGAGYTRTEDYLVCKAFIAASEDPFVGTSQKGKDFRKKMHEKYKEPLTQQVRFDQLKYSSATADARLLIPEPAVYEARNPESLYSRFKSAILLCKMDTPQSLMNSGLSALRAFSILVNIPSPRLSSIWPSAVLR